MNRKTATGQGQKPRALFYLIALLLPVVFFAVLEGGIRLTGLAAEEPLFIAGPPGYLRPNEAVVNRFFIHPSRAPRVSIDTTFFRETKPDDLFRVVVQGGSSAAGFPYGKWASLTGMLGARLKRAAPGREIEVVSTAMSAVNSYALVDFADEIIELQPDAVVIYAGHNEYLGVLGVGSAYGAGRSPAVTRALLTLRESHLFRAMQYLYGALIGPSAPESERRSGTLMARIARERAIVYGSESYQAGLEQFRNNLALLLRRYAAAGVPVFIGTLASNESGQAPFINGAGDTTSLDAIRRLGGDPGSNDADGFFALGRSLQNSGDNAGAREAYRWARDLDALRFRAPSAMNGILELSAGDGLATIVRAEEMLAGEARDGIIGNDLMLEHLHPNLRGYFLLAEAYYEALTERIEPERWSDGPDRAAAWRDIPVTEIDELAAGYRLRYLKSDWPFRDEKQPVTLPEPQNAVEHIAQDWFLGRLSWQEAMQRALVHYQQVGRTDLAARVAMNLAEAFPFEASPHYVSGRLLLATGRPRLGASYLEEALGMAPGDPDIGIALADAYRELGRETEARRALEEVLRRHPGNEEALSRLEDVSR
jgi:tetratricopeptide (TPR) repeat protein